MLERVRLTVLNLARQVYGAKVMIQTEREDDGDEGWLARVVVGEIVLYETWMAGGEADVLESVAVEHLAGQRSHFAYLAKCGSRRRAREDLEQMPLLGQHERKKR